MHYTRYFSLLFLLILSGSCNTPQATGETEPEVLPADMYRGTLVLAPRVQVFIPCGSDRPFWIDAVSEELRTAYQTQQSGGQYQPVYMVVEGDLKASRAQPYGQALTVRTVFESRSGIPEDCQTGTSSVFEAQGNEPGWKLTIDPAGKTITLVSQYGEKKTTFTYFPPVPWGDDRTYFTQDEKAGPLVIEVFRKECTDSMSGHRYTHEVKVKTTDGVLQGCGGKKMVTRD